jgi:uncharacterized protein YfaP (DUF2135 family)
MNAKGPVTIEGPGSPNIVQWYLYEITTGATPELARAALARIVERDTTVGDTLAVDVDSPPDADASYFAATTLSVPSAVNCDVGGTVDPVDVHFLYGSLTVRSSSDITLADQHGPFDIATVHGALALQVFPPVPGRCSAMTGKGGITLQVPATASATLIATTAHGTVTVTGLSLADRVDGAGSVQGRLGAGADTVRVSTADGDIVLQAIP